MHSWNGLRSLLQAGVLCFFAITSARADTPATQPCVFDANGRAAIGGRAAFPLAIFVDLAPELAKSDPQRLARTLDQIANSPFRVLINHASSNGTVEQIAQYQAELAKRGLTEFSAIGGSESAVSDAVRQAAGCASVAGWYLSPEAVSENGKAKARIKELKQLDPARPVLVAVKDAENADEKEAVARASIASIYAYPVPRRRLIDVVDSLNQLMTAGKEDQPKWFILQAFGEYVYDKRIREESGKPTLEEVVGSRRAPTPKEMRAMAYLALAHGATGLAVYYHKDIELAADAEQRWKALARIGNEINAIAPYLMGTVQPRESMHDDNYSIHLRLTELNGKRYLLAVNSTREYQNTFIDRLPWNIRKVRVIHGHGFAAGSSDYGTNEIVIGLDALDSVFIEIE